MVIIYIYIYFPNRTNLDFTKCIPILFLIWALSCFKYLRVTWLSIFYGFCVYILTYGIYILTYKWRAFSSYFRRLSALQFHSEFANAFQRRSLIYSINQKIEFDSFQNRIVHQIRDENPFILFSLQGNRKLI